jgi:DNA polymerase III epsilon subunit-like protein
MSLNRKIICFDFETDGTNPNECQPVEIAAVAIDNRTLEIVPNSEFHSMMKPDGIEKEGYLTDSVKDCVAWHAKMQKTTPEAILENWRKAPEQKVVWERFNEYILKYNWKKNNWFAPIACGANIRNFDLKIVDRLNDKYKVKFMFWKRDVVDIQDLSFLWLTWHNECPKNFKVDTLREWFGKSMEGQHTAIQDVRDEAWFATKYLKLHRHVVQEVGVKFK